MLIRGGTMFASITDWICGDEPAVILEIVQHASFLIPSFGDDKRERRAGSAPDAMTTWVCKSSPVTILPTERRAGVWTAVDGCMSRSTRRLHTPDSITAWILSFEPSERYEIAQQASMRISSSRE